MCPTCELTAEHWPPNARLYEIASRRGDVALRRGASGRLEPAIRRVAVLAFCSFI